MHRLLSLFALVLAFSLGAPHAEAASKKQRTPASIEVPQAVKDATVNLYCRIRSGKKIFSSTGTGVFIGSRGIVLTNAHVAQYLLLEDEGKVSGGCTVRTGSPAKDAYEAELLYLPEAWLDANAAELSKNKPKGSGENDFALLKVTEAKKGTLPISFPALPLDLVENPLEGETVTITAYPAGKLSFDQIKKKLPQVSATSTISRVYTLASQTADLMTLEHSSVASSGSSGSPVIDATGKVMGLVSAMSTSKDQPSLRALTLPYVNRALTAQTGITLPSLLLSDSSIQTNGANAVASEDASGVISKAIFKKR